MSFLRKDNRTEVSPTMPGTSLPTRELRSGFIGDFDSIFDEFRRSFDNLMMPYYPFEIFRKRDERGFTQFAPIDLIDEGDQYRVHAELPGMSKEDVEVNITADGLTIRAQKEECSEGDEKYLHRERFCSLFRRDIHFPEEVDTEHAKGSMKNGLLELHIPKKEPQKQETRRLELE